ncbi:YncE family protein [Candidatus Nitrososphaera evergladensis]|jgi:YVTN family beta-propeller protein|nr:YncE family protein [Candidatus Nitrososphaera evergladensis]
MTSVIAVAPLHLQQQLAFASSSDAAATDSDNNSTFVGSNSQIIAATTSVRPESIAVNPNTGIVYVANWIDYLANTTGAFGASGSISVINGSSTELMSYIALDGAPLKMAVNPNTGMVYVTESRNNLVAVIDGTANKVIDTIRVGNRPAGVAVNPNTNMVYVANWNYPDGFVSVINGSTNSIVANVTLGTGASYGIAVNPNTNKVYVDSFAYSRNGSNIVSVIDGSTNKVVANVTVGALNYVVRTGVSTFPDAFRYGVDIAVNPKTNMIYTDNNYVSVIDGAVNKVVANVTLDSLPLRAISVNPETNLVYVPNSEGNIQVIDGSTNEVMGMMKLGGVISDVVFNPNTDKLFVASETSVNKASVIITDDSNIQRVPEFPAYFLTIISLAIPLAISVGYARYRKLC